MFFFMAVFVSWDGKKDVFGGGVGAGFSSLTLIIALLVL